MSPSNPFVHPAVLIGQSHCPMICCTQFVVQTKWAVLFCVAHCGLCVCVRACVCVWCPTLHVSTVCIMLLCSCLFSMFAHQILARSRWAPPPTLSPSFLLSFRTPPSTREEPHVSQHTSGCLICTFNRVTCGLNSHQTHHKQ